MPLTVNVVGPDGRWYAVLTLMINSATNLQANDNEAFVITDSVTNAFVGAFQIPVGGETEIQIDDGYLTTPNDLGPPPQPVLSDPEPLYIPQDSYPILVGYGTIDTTTYPALRRQQYWHRSNESYGLGQGESMTIATTTTTGIQSSSSHIESVATSLGVSASAGWGPISTSVTASLNTSTTTQQSMTISETNSTYITSTMSNTQQADIMVVHWNIIDAVLVSPGQFLNPVTDVVEVAYAPRIVQTYQLPNPPSASSGH
jgi:hypothetical protein